MDKLYNSNCDKDDITRELLYHKIDTLCADKKHFLKQFIKELSNNNDLDILINLEQSTERYFIVEKELLINLMMEKEYNYSNPIWERLSKSCNKTKRYLFRKYQVIIKELNQRVNKNNSFKSDSFDSSTKHNDKENKVFCICGEVWKGEFMIECDCCCKWFHPGCLKGKRNSYVIEFYEDQVVCLSCKEQHQEKLKLAQLCYLNDITKKATKKRKKVRKISQGNESLTTKSFIFDITKRQNQRTTRKLREAPFHSTLKRTSKTVRRP